jgi:CRP/FNR family transcriptional regulator
MTEASILAAARANPVLATLPEPAQTALLAAGRTRRLAAGEIFCLTGEAWPYLFLLTAGQVSAWKESREGRSLLVGTFEPGDLFWGTAFFLEDAPQPVNLEARQPSQILVWGREGMLPFLQGEGGLAWELSRLLVAQMLRVSDLIERLAFQPVAGRVARFLLDQAGPDDGAARDFTLDEAAAQLGTTREMVCRALHNFEAGGLIWVTRTAYSITDRERLAQLAQQEKG